MPTAFCSMSMPIRAMPLLSDVQAKIPTEDWEARAFSYETQTGQSSHDTFETGARRAVIYLARSRDRKESSIVQAEALLYVCLHNPCNETPIVEVRTPVEKVQNRCIQLLIVLPEILAFAHVLENGGSWRLRTNHNCSYVTNLSDFQHWLMGLSMSLPTCDYSIIFPVAEEKPLQDCCVWKACRAAFGDESCSVLKSVM